jgi:hypothetical protein
MKTLDDMGPSKLLPDEQDSVREAADVLFFAEQAEDLDFDALERTRATIERLVSTERWTEERAGELAADLEACGPGVLVS